MPYQAIIPDTAPNLETWKHYVKLKDNYTCQICGRYYAPVNCRKSPVEAHHILRIKDRPDLMLEVSNGRTVCIRCHNGAHIMIDDSTRKELLEFPNEYLTAKESAKLLNISINDVYNCQKRYGLVGMKIERRWYFHKDDLNRVIDPFNERPEKRLS